MAVVLAPAALSDAAVTDGIGRGDVGDAARLWVRHWPHALGAARALVRPLEVPGLAAEALIGTIAAIAVGHGPREDVGEFVLAAVLELGADDEPPVRSEVTYPDVLPSALMQRAYDGLPADDQILLQAAYAAENHEVADALTELQSSYLAEHLAAAESDVCRTTHAGLASAAEAPGTGTLRPEDWIHLSECAWCTEAFHEVAFSNIALDALVVLPPSPLPSPILAAPVIATPTPVRRRGRRIIAGVTAAAAAAAVAVLVISSTGGSTAPAPAAGPERVTEATPTPGSFVSVAPPVAIDNTTPSELPSLTPTPSSAAKPASETAVPTPKPSTPAKPSSTPRPLPTPTTGPTAIATVPVAAPPTPAPVPTTTPTPARCNPLAHLLRFC